MSQLIESALIGGEADADVDFLVGIVGTVVVDLETVGHQLHDVADVHDVCAEAAGLLPVDRNLPFDARCRSRVFKLDQAFDGAHLFQDLFENGIEGLRISR